MAAKKAEGQLYRKRGKHYVPVSDPWAHDGLRAGHWHVHVREGNTTIREPIWPDRLAVSAAIEEVRDAMVEAMVKANAPAPAKRALTAIERKAYDAYLKVLGDDKAAAHFNRKAMWDVVQAGIDALKTAGV